MIASPEMRPAGALTEATRNLTSSKGEAEAGGLRSLKSPVPYFFGGLAIIITLISVPLLILACSHRKLSWSSSSSSFSSAYFSSSSSSSSSSEDQQQESKATVDVGGEVDSEPKILVVMAGDSNPTFLAKPLSLANAYAQQSL